MFEYINVVKNVFFAKPSKKIIFSLTDEYHEGKTNPFLWDLIDS